MLKLQKGDTKTAKQRITKQDVANAAFEAARKGGMQAVTLKNIEKRLDCSPQPIYSCYADIGALRQDVENMTDAFAAEFAKKRAGEDALAGTGRAYIQFAEEEPELFRIFITHRRRGISSLRELYAAYADPNAAKQRGTQTAQAERLHLHMLIYTVGLGAIFSAAYPGIKIDEIYSKQKEAFEAFLAAEGQEKSKKKKKKNKR